MYKSYAKILEQLKLDGNLRKLPNGLPEDCINLSSNDYLGLNSDDKLRNLFLEKKSASNLKFSAVSSRLLTGNSSEYNILENTILKAYNREACLIFNSGYHANIGILPCLAGKKDLLLADKFVHASIIDGMQLSKAEILRFNHLDYSHLENILEKKRSDYDKVFIVSESIFSMDGDKADMMRLVEIKRKYNCILYFDEAHALGVYGSNGLGYAEECNLLADCDILVGTFGEALASVGAFVVCDSIIKEYIYSR